jgi:hypothetical protein
MDESNRLKRSDKVCAVTINGDDEKSQMNNMDVLASTENEKSTVNQLMLKGIQDHCLLMNDTDNYTLYIIIFHAPCNAAGKKMAVL